MLKLLLEPGPGIYAVRKLDSPLAIPVNVAGKIKAVGVVGPPGTQPVGHWTVVAVVELPKAAVVVLQRW